MTVHFTLTSGIEKRLSAWSKYVKTVSEKQEKVAPCITISREFGCQGYPVAQALEQRLNGRKEEDKWVVLDRLLLDKIAEDSGISKSDIERTGDHNPIFQSMIAMFMGQHQAEQFEIFAYIKKAVRHFAKAGQCIIVGRGAVTLTQDFSNCYHFRLIAPMEFRIKNIMEVQEVDRNEAEKFIEAHHKQREDFIQHFTQMSLSDPALYHLTINNAKYTPKQIAELIVKSL